MPAWALILHPMKWLCSVSGMGWETMGRRFKVKGEESTKNRRGEWPVLVQCRWRRPAEGKVFLN